MDNSSKKFDFHFFQNTECRYFPCHEGIPTEEFNCLFCYCPLMFVECNGNYTRMDNGYKDCSQCTYNHDKSAWKNIVQELNGLMSIKTKFSKINKENE